MHGAITRDSALCFVFRDIYFMITCCARHSPPLEDDGGDGSFSGVINRFYLRGAKDAGVDASSENLRTCEVLRLYTTFLKSEKSELPIKINLHFIFQDP